MAKRYRFKRDFRGRQILQVSKEVGVIDVVDFEPKYGWVNADRYEAEEFLHTAKKHII